MSWGKLKTIWQENIKENIKKISAILGDIIISIITIALFALKADLDPITAIMMVVFGIKPFVVMYLNIVFKGEAEGLSVRNLELQKKLSYEREIAEYRVQLAAKNGSVPDIIIADKDWRNNNEMIRKLKEEENK